MRRYYAGLDVHSKSCTYAIQDESGATVSEGSIATSLEGLQGWRQRYDLPMGTRVGLETGTVAFYVARLLTRLDLEPVVIDAHEVRLKAHRPTQKSDRRDAWEICEGVRRGLYRAIVHVPPVKISELRDSLSRRRHFVRLQTAEVNAVKRLLRAAGLGVMTRRSLRTARAWEGLLAALALEDEPSLRGHVELHRAVWVNLAAQVETLAARLAEQAEPLTPQVEQLRTVLGVGPMVALTAVAVFSDPHRFGSAKHAASYVGLAPSTFQSGDRDVHGRITRRGSSELRAMLCEAAHHARRPDHPLNPYFRRLCARRGYKMAVVAVAHRLCRILWAMLRDEKPFDVSKLGVEIGPFEKRSTQLYRLRRPEPVPA
jgi:transposase